MLKYYYEIYKKINDNLSQFICIVENKEIAEDFCNKNSDYIFEENFIKTETSSKITLFNDMLDLSENNAIKCPHCGKSYYREGTTSTTAMYCPSIYKDGKLVSKDMNYVTTDCYCLNCHNSFKIIRHAGEIKVEK